MMIQCVLLTQLSAILQDKVSQSLGTHIQLNGLCNTERGNNKTTGHTHTHTQRKERLHNTTAVSLLSENDKCDKRHSEAGL